MSGKAKSGEPEGITGIILKPMWVTLKTGVNTLLSKPRTNLYPHEKVDTPENWKDRDYKWRGQHEIDWGLCIGCAICARVCPNDCIYMENCVVEDGKTGEMTFSRAIADDKKNVVRRPGVDIGHCLFCGFCEEYCPTEAWRMTNEFQLADTERDRLYYSAEKLRKDDPTLIEARGLENRAQENPMLFWDKCTGCAACVRNCPTRCISLVEAGKTEKGRPNRKVVFNYDQCIGCRTCVDACKFDSLEMRKYTDVRNPAEAAVFVDGYGLHWGGRTAGVEQAETQPAKVTAQDEYDEAHKGQPPLWPVLPAPAGKGKA